MQITVDHERSLSDEIASAFFEEVICMLLEDYPDPEDLENFYAKIAEDRAKAEKTGEFKNFAKELAATIIDVGFLQVNEGIVIMHEDQNYVVAVMTNDEDDEDDARVLIIGSSDDYPQIQELEHGQRLFIQTGVSYEEANMINELITKLGRSLTLEEKNTIFNNQTIH